MAGHAVVVGGSIGGLLAASALASSYERVIGAERLAAARRPATRSSSCAGS
jgi:2-polyprenyl-6-methoxyphenol hydroxylase-like FAD-dependent oxidoreductase